MNTKRWCVLVCSHPRSFHSAQNVWISCHSHWSTFCIEFFCTLFLCQHNCLGSECEHCREINSCAGKMGRGWCLNAGSCLGQAVSCNYISHGLIWRNVLKKQWKCTLEVSNIQKTSFRIYALGHLNTHLSGYPLKNKHFDALSLGLKKSSHLDSFRILKRVNFSLHSMSYVLLSF